MCITYDFPYEVTSLIAMTEPILTPCQNKKASVNHRMLFY